MALSIEDAWFASSRDEYRIKDDAWENAKEFEKRWVKQEIDPDDWNVTPWGSITLDLENDLGLISLEFGGNQVGYFTDLPGRQNYGSEGFVWDDHEELPANLKLLLEGVYPKN